ncbi:hypothetical protein V2O64_24310 (plasmid) [Verrucomicrobiaceae bacterium 227]
MKRKRLPILLRTIEISKKEPSVRTQTSTAIDVIGAHRQPIAPGFLVAAGAPMDSDASVEHTGDDETGQTD